MTGTLEYSSRGRALGPRSGDGDGSATGTRVGVVSARGRPHPSMWKQPDAKVPYLPGLDGLRAIAVVAVLLFHAEVPAVQGGFLGVDVFFVISGYLITAILLTQWRNRRWIDLKTFYWRRARRLLPALFLVLFGVTLISVLFLRDEVATLRGDVIASLTYVTNWFFVFGQKSYFESSGRESLVKHLWSLAVEEQFYLVWPVLFAVAMRKLGQRGLLIAILVGAAASTLLMAVLYDPNADPSRVWYGTDTRAAALLIGSALALVWAPHRLRRTVGRGAPFLLDLVGVVALVTLVLMLSVTDQFSESLYRGGFLKLSIVTAVLIAAVVHPAAHIGQVMGMRPLRWLGLRSYGIYLFHWPVYMLTRPVLDVPLTGWTLLVLRLAITMALATLSYRYVETPIRTGAVRRAFDEWRQAPHRERGRTTVRWGAATLAGVLAVGVVGFAMARAELPATPDYLLAGSTTNGLPPSGSTTDGLPPAPAAGLPPGTAPSGTSSTVPPATAVADPGAGDPSTPVEIGPDGLPLAVVPSTTVAPSPAETAPPTPLRITAIGDSVMLGAAPALTSTLNGSVFVDARVNRQVSECLSILHVWHDQGLLGDVVVVHIGNNGPFNADQFAEMRDLLAQVPKVIFLTNKVPRMWEEPNNQIIRDGAASMPNAVLIDWRVESDPHPEMFYADGIHLRPDGAAFYASLINARL
jgi:peptidoglycan/LPS O-acetylase OafA/YrhL